MKRPTGEILALLATGVLFQLFESVLDLKVPYLVAVTLAWSAYVVRRIRARPEVIEEWGLGRRGLQHAARICALVLLAAATGMALWRWVDGWTGLPLSSLRIFLGYPVWAVIQEFAVQGLVVVNLEKLGWRRGAIIPVAAILFGLAHFPDWPLVGLCTVAGLAWTAIFLRTRNLWPIALCHAWCGTLAFYWLLERDPLTEMGLA